MMTIPFPPSEDTPPGTLPGPDPREVPPAPSPLPGPDPTLDPTTAPGQLPGPAPEINGVTSAAFAGEVWDDESPANEGDDSAGGPSSSTAVPA